MEHIISISNVLSFIGKEQAQMAKMSILQPVCTGLTSTYSP
jgi:hypothetical protein